MSNITEKTSSNIFYKARHAASAHNRQLSSREGAADIMTIDRGRLYRIENEKAVPYQEEICRMADCYKAPELENYYCTNFCPLGKDMPKVAIEDLDRIVVRAVSMFRKLDKTEEIFLDIAEDGIISDDERPDLNRVLKVLTELERITHSLKIWAKKNW